MVLYLAFSDLVEGNRDRFVGIDFLFINQGLACEELSPVRERQLLDANPVVQLARTLGHDVDEAKLGVGVLEQRVEISENGLTHNVPLLFVGG
jgi:hypothetical protein